MRRFGPLSLSLIVGFLTPLPVGLGEVLIFASDFTTSAWLRIPRRRHGPRAIDEVEEPIPPKKLQKCLGPADRHKRVPENAAPRESSGLLVIARRHLDSLAVPSYASSQQAGIPLGKISCAFVKTDIA